ncbi:MAG: PIG-L family deacetylase [Bacteroidia bacterium]|jgi:LmbE family N-acetylglucosaminyl deacetylase|nr:PIG-L family deacetylase [Bacteroidia bacterium]
MYASRLLVLLFIPALMVCGKSDKTDYNRYREAQDFTVPVWNCEEENKTALFIFPHDDDVISCAGSSQWLREKNWTLYSLTLTEDADPKERAKRSVEWSESMKLLGFKESIHLYFPNNVWSNVERNELVFWNEHSDSVEATVYRFIQKYKPSVIFTFDSIVGGYGHPEHRLTGRAVGRVFAAHKHEAGFPVKRIMCFTLPEKLEQVWLGQNPAYLLTQKYNGPASLPEPNAAVDVRKYWPVKRNAAAVYKTQQATLKKFMMLPDIKDTSAHYQAFCREYFLELN